MKRLIAWAMARKPDFIVGGAETPYLRRWWLIPRNRLFNVYLHQFVRSDDDRALHDHPWLFNASILIAGEYREHTISAGGARVVAHRRAGDWKFRWGPAPHRVELLDELINVDGPGFVASPLPCWTIFVTGPVVRVWGFHCPTRWVPWQEFVDARDKGSIGKGCGE